MKKNKIFIKQGIGISEKAKKQEGIAGVVMYVNYKSLFWLH